MVIIRSEIERERENILNNSAEVLEKTDVEKTANGLVSVQTTTRRLFHFRVNNSAALHIKSFSVARLSHVYNIQSLYSQVYTFSLGIQ